MTTPLFETPADGPGSFPLADNPSAGPAPGAASLHPESAAPGPHVGEAEPDGTAAASPTPLVITVYGTPAPQGSKRHVGNGVMIESSEKVKPWREAVKWAAMDALDDAASNNEPFGKDPVWVSITFRFARPKFHFRTGKNSHLLRDNAPTFPAGKPDVDKCCRSTLDSLTDSGVLHDDAQVVLLSAMKTYSHHQAPGARITIRAIP